MICLLENTRTFSGILTPLVSYLFHLCKPDVDECEQFTEGTLCPDNSKCINLEPREDPRGFKCECHNGKPPVNGECDSKSDILFPRS